MASERQGHETKYSFNVLSNKRFSFLHDRHTSELFMKWSMLGRITAQAFNFDQYFQPYKKHDFALDFFKDPCVKSNLKVLDASGLWKVLDSEITKVNVESVPCTRTSMDLFDPLYSCGILRPSGHIVKCFHDFYADFDELRNMLLIEDSDNYEIICREDREEFLFRLFKHFCLGGELCQYEDVVDPYIETTKSVYKDLISVFLYVTTWTMQNARGCKPIHNAFQTTGLYEQLSGNIAIIVQKDPEMKEIRVISTVLKVSAYDDSGLCYPSCKDEEQTFAYLIVDPFKRHVYVLYHCFGVGLFSVPEKEAK